MKQGTFCSYREEGGGKKIKRGGGGVPEKERDIDVLNKRVQRK